MSRPLPPFPSEVLDELPAPAAPTRQRASKYDDYLDGRPHRIPLKAIEESGRTVGQVTGSIRVRANARDQGVTVFVVQKDGESYLCVQAREKRGRGPAEALDVSPADHS